MSTVLESSKQGTHLHGDPSPFLGFVNIGPPYTATLSLPIFTIGLPLWLFSTPMIQNYPRVSNAKPPPQEHKPHVDLFPSSHVRYSSLSSS